MPSITEYITSAVTVIAAMAPVILWLLRRVREKTEWGKANQGVVDLLVGVIEDIENSNIKPKPVKQEVHRASAELDPKVAKALHDALDKLRDMRKAQQSAP